jgi:glycosyltransferase involved in cell wall biosynthesis
VLVVDHFVPQPNRDAGSRTMMGFLRVMVQAGLVVKFWPHNMQYSAGYTETLQAMGIEVFHGHTQMPFARWIKENGSELDCVLLSRPEVAQDVIDLIRLHSRCRVIYYGHDLHFLRMRRQAQVMQDPQLLRAAERMEETERSIWNKADLSLYPSEEESDIASALRPDRPFQAVVPYAFDSFPTDRAVPPGQEIIFVAGFGHPPNEDAACWFSGDVLPLIRAVCPDARLSIIGSNPGTCVKALAGDGVAIFADVSDAELAEAYGRARVAVVPLRCGAGVKLKVVEALHVGVPLVTTPVGAQGLPGIFRVCAVESEPDRFASAVIALLRDDAAWTLNSAAQRAFAADRFSTDAMAASLLAALGMPAPSKQRPA